ncbi:MAG: FAD binding domain-containing protein [Dehalococcoidia bacterium]
MIRFDYFEPSTLDEATAFLLREGEKARVLAGGTDLLPLLKQRAIRPRYLVNIKRISHLDSISHVDGGGLRIGALTTIRTLETSAPLRDGWGMVAQAAGHLGSVQVRNIATVGGNLCHGVPSAETAPALIALSAEAALSGPQGRRSLPLEDFFTGPGTTVLGAGELLAELLLPPPPSPSGGVYLKLSPRGAMDIAVVGVAAWIALDGRDGSCRDCRLVLGAVAPTPFRVKRAEDVLRGEKVTERLIDAAARTAMEESRPISDVRASAEYRREMVGVLTRRALSQALEMARQRTTG